MSAHLPNSLCEETWALIKELINGGFRLSIYGDDNWAIEHRDGKPGAMAFCPHTDSAFLRHELAAIVKTGRL